MSLSHPPGAFVDPNLFVDWSTVEDRGGVCFADVFRTGRESPVFVLAWDPNKAGVRIAPAETDEQAVFVSTARRAGMRLHSVPNGGLRETRTAVQMKREGMSPGAPDIVVWGGPVATPTGFALPPCVFEFKRANGSLSDFQANQLEWLEYIHTNTPGFAAGVLGYKAGLELLRKVGYAL